MTKDTPSEKMPSEGTTIRMIMHRELEIKTAEDALTDMIEDRDFFIEKYVPSLLNKDKGALKADIESAVGSEPIEIAVPVLALISIEAMKDREIHQLIRPMDPEAIKKCLVHKEGEELPTEVLEEAHHLLHGGVQAVCAQITSIAFGVGTKILTEIAPQYIPKIESAFKNHTPESFIAVIKSLAGTVETVQDRAATAALSWVYIQQYKQSEYMSKTVSQINELMELTSLISGKDAPDKDVSDDDDKSISLEEEILGKPEKPRVIH